MANQDLKENVLLNLRSVTQSVKGGVPFERLQRDYKDLLGSPIPFRELGYNSLEAFIRDIPDVITLRKNNEGQLMAMGVADASTAHIVSLVQRQKGDTRKKPFKKFNPNFGARKPLTSRYTFREGFRGSHSSYTSPPHATSKAKPSKPSVQNYKHHAVAEQVRPRVAAEQVRPRAAAEQVRPRAAAEQVRPRAAAEQVRPRAAAEQVLPRAVAEQVRPRAAVEQIKPRAAEQVSVPIRKYEVAPRFLKKKESLSNSSAVRPQSPPITPPVLQELISSSNQSSFSLNDSEAIPPPRAVCRSLPIKPPQPIENTRTHSYDALKSARNPKEFIEMYAEMNNTKPVYRTVRFGQKEKNKGYVSTLILNDKKYHSYPDMKPSEELAEEEVARKAMTEIKERKEDLHSLPETLYSNAEEISILLSRIEEIVCEKPSGMFDNGIIREYEENFKERLPPCWSDLLKKSIYIEMEELKFEYGKKPEGVNFIVRPVKELSSGNQTPSSTSSKTEHVFGDLDSRSLKQSLVSISLPQVPDIKIPTGNFWEVFITDVSDSLSARLIDYDDEFIALSDDMNQYYALRSLPVTEIFEHQVYAACIEDVWHRVIVDEIKDDEQKREPQQCVATGPLDLTILFPFYQVDFNQLQVSCYFVDNGDISVVLKENLQEMCPRFLQLPYQAIHLALDDLDECENCIGADIFEKHILGKTLIAEVKRWYPIPEFFSELSGINRTVYYVVLFDTSDSSGVDVNLNELLKKTAIESLVCKLPKLSTTSCAYLSHVTHEGQVYLRLKNPQECWIEVELERLSSNLEDSAIPTNIPRETMCAAKYESGIWHRAIVTESLHTVDPEVVEVFFVDHGHVLTVGKSEIRELKPVSELLASVPPQAICCELANALPSSRAHWTGKATEKLLQLAPFGQELFVRVVSEEDGMTLAKVNLLKRNEDSNIISINESLSCNPSLFHEEPASVPIKTPSMLPLRQNSRRNSIKSNLSGVIPDVAVPAEEQMAKRLGNSISSEKIEWLNTPDNIKSPDAFEVQSPVSLSLPEVPEEGAFFDVFVTMACHPHNFVVQPLDSCSELDALMADMRAFYSVEDNLLDIEDFSMLRKNDYYAALHSDGSWYRARIEQIINDSPVVMVVVNYVDFGDFSSIVIGRLQPLYQQFKSLPCQAIKASLAGIKPLDSDWTPVNCVKFKEMVTEKKFVSVIYSKKIEIEDEIPSLHIALTLIDTTDPEQDVYIHELLVAKKIAREN